MNVTPLRGYLEHIASVNIAPVELNRNKAREEQPVEELPSGQPSFMDVFTNVYREALDAGQTKSEDMIRLMLGDADDLEQIQLNIQKAEFANDLFVEIRNTVLDAYNEIIRMQI